MNVIEYIAVGLLVAASIVIVVKDSIHRWRHPESVRPAPIRHPQCQANIRAYWRTADSPALDRQPAVRDALAILRDAAERLEDYGPHDM